MCVSPLHYTSKTMQICFYKSVLAYVTPWHRNVMRPLDTRRVLWFLCDTIGKGSTCNSLPGPCEPPPPDTQPFTSIQCTTLSQRWINVIDVDSALRLRGVQNTFVLCARFIGDRSGTSPEKKPWHWSDLSLISFRKVKSDRKCCNMKNRKLGSDQCQSV